MKYKIADTATFLRLGAGTAWETLCDPQGMHIAWNHFLHNDTHIRASWFVKVKGSDEPSHVTFDVPLDEFNKLPEIAEPA